MLEVLIATAVAGAVVVYIFVVGPLFAFDRKANGGLSEYQLRDIRKRGERAPAVVLSETPVDGADATVVIVEVTPSHGPPFRAEIGCATDRRELPFGYGGEDSRRNELAEGAKIHVFFVPGPPRVVIVDCAEIDLTLDEKRAMRSREIAEREASKNQEREARRQSLLRGDEAPPRKSDDR